MGFIENQPGAYWVEPRRLAAGPHAAMISAEASHSFREQLRAAGFSSVIDLTEEATAASNAPASKSGSVGDGTEAGLRYHRFPIPDMQVPSVELMADLLDYLQAELNAGQRVYLHCMAGLGRTGTTVACYLVRNGMSGERALDELMDIRRSQGELAPSPETEGQRRFVLAWQQLDPALHE